MPLLNALRASAARLSRSRRPTSPAAWATVAASLLVLLTAQPALANGAMSLALATFAWGPWLLYVAATVVFEAALMGRWLGIRFARALWTSLLANGLTCILGTVLCCSGIFGYMLLGVFGSRLDPNPLGQTLLAFTLFALVSAYLEAFLWIDDALEGPSRGHKEVLKRSLVVHLLGVPVGLCILLAPERPYAGLESQVAGLRRRDDRELLRALQEYVVEHEALPQDRTFGGVLQRLRPRLSPDAHAHRRDGWTLAYEPVYHRFDRREMRRNPIEWNAALAGKRLGTGPLRTLWLCRSRNNSFEWGWVVTLPAGNIKRTINPVEIGYPP
jgi:hypothetical protein